MTTMRERPHARDDGAKGAHDRIRCQACGHVASEHRVTGVLCQCWDPVATGWCRCPGFSPEDRR